MLTMYNIAKAAGVSQTTVSFILNNDKKSVNFKKETKQKVLKIAQKFNYRLNAQARSISTGKSNFITLLMQDSGTHEYSARIVASVIKEAASYSYHINVQHYDNNTFSKTVINIFEQRPAGIICRSNNELLYKSLLKEGKNLAIPVVFIDNVIDNRKGIFIDSDQENGVFLAIEHLYKLGHRKIAHLNPQRGNTKYNAFLKAMEFFNLKVFENYIKISEEKDIEKVLQELLGLTPNERPTAIFCASDYLAMIFIRYANKHGIKLPDNMSVIGYANLETAGMIYPALTTINQPFEEESQLAVKELVNDINLPVKQFFSKKTIKYIPVKLVVRESTSKPMEL